MMGAVAMMLGLASESTRCLQVRCGCDFSIGIRHPGFRQVNFLRVCRARRHKAVLAYAEFGDTEDGGGADCETVRMGIFDSVAS